jgi:Uncharacterized conserved protein
MKVLEGERQRLRIYLGESDRWHHQNLATALLEKLRKEGCAGATVFHGVAGFGANSVIHTTSLLRLSEDLPVLVEVVDTEEQIAKLLPLIEEMVLEGLVTLEPVQVLKYASGKQPKK